MNQETYKVVLSGKTVKNKDMADVKQRMAALFKTSAPVIEKLFARRKPVVKKNLSLEKANRYAKAIEKAGAACYVKKMAPSAESPPAENPPEPPGTPQASQPEQDAHAAPATQGLKVIPVQTTYKGEERFLPKPVEKLSASPTGLNFNAEGLLDVSYDQIAALASYSPITPENESSEASMQFLIFLKDMEQPFAMPSSVIDYHTFQENAPAKPAAAFRGFLHFLCRQNTTMILEETTFDFLSGNTLPQFDHDKAMKYITAIGRLIEEGGEGEEG